jgi:predicted HTH domain antitoxin
VLITGVARPGQAGYNDGEDRVMVTSLPIDWRLEHLVKLQSVHPELVNRALEKMIAEDEELRWSLVVSAYLDEEISLAKAASLLNLHPVELRRIFLERGIPIYLGAETVEEAQAEVDALKAAALNPE